MTILKKSPSNAMIVCSDRLSDSDHLRSSGLHQRDNRSGSNIGHNEADSVEPFPPRKGNLRTPVSAPLRHMVCVQVQGGNHLKRNRSLFPTTADHYHLSSPAYKSDIKASIIVMANDTDERAISARVDLKLSKLTPRCDAFLRKESQWQIDERGGVISMLRKPMTGLELQEFVRRAVSRSKSVALMDFRAIEESGHPSPRQPLMESHFRDETKDQMALARIKLGIKKGLSDQQGILTKIRVNHGRVRAINQTVDTTRAYMEPALLLGQNLIELGHDTNRIKSEDTGVADKHHLKEQHKSGTSEQTYTAVFEKQSQRVVDAIVDTRALAFELCGREANGDLGGNVITSELGQLRKRLRKHVTQAEVAPYSGLACVGIGCAAMAGLHWLKGERAEALVFGITWLGIVANLYRGLKGVMSARQALASLEKRYSAYQNRLIKNLDNASAGTINMAEAANTLKQRYCERAEALQVRRQLEMLLKGFQSELDHGATTNHEAS